MKPFDTKILLGWSASLLLAMGMVGAEGGGEPGTLPVKEIPAPELPEINPKKLKEPEQPGIKPKGMPALDTPEIKLPPRTQIPEDMKQLVEGFQKQAQVYVAQQKELWKQAKGASAEERQQVLEQLKTTRQSFLDQTRDIRADIRERIKDLKVSIRDSRPQAAGASEGGGRTRHGRD